jgi:integrase
MVRFNRGGKFVMKRAQHAANGKLMPRRAAGMHSDIEGACRYYLRYRLPDGRRVYDPVGESSIEALAAANRKEIELFAALRSAEVAKPDTPQVAPSRVKVDNAIGQYLCNFASPDQRTTFLAYRRALDIFREACTCEYVDQITVDCVRSFVARLRGEFDQDTVYHRYHYVEFFLGKHGKNNLLLKSERPKKRPVDEDGTDLATYEVGGVAGLVAAAETERDRLVVLIPSESGLRKDEVAHLEKADILDGQIIVRSHKMQYRRWKTKTGRGRTVDVPRWLTDRIKAWIATLSERQSLFFVTEDGNPDRHLEYLVNELAAKAGVKVPVTASGQPQPFHGLRSYWAIQRLRQGHDLNTVRRWGGWKDLKVMLRYLAKARGISDDARRLLDGGQDGKVA